MRCGSKLAPRCHRPLHPVLSRRLPTHRLPNLTSGISPCSRLPGFDSRSQEDTAAPFVSLMCMMRNRDLVCAMLRHRMERIEYARWDTAGSLPEDELALLSQHEQRYSSRFNELLSEYQAANDIDLTRDHDPPSDNLYISVNVLQDVGQYVGPESGTNLDLKRGDLSFLRRGDVEHLVRQGLVTQVN